MRKPALIGLTLVAAIPAAFLCYQAILGIMTHAGRQQFTSKMAIILYVTAVVSALIAVWPPLWAIVWYGSPAKEADAADSTAEAAAEEAVGDAEVLESDEEAEAEGFHEEDLDAFDGQPPPRDADDDFDVSEDDISQVETDDFQLDGDDEFGDLDFDEAEEEEEEAPKAKAKKKKK